MSRLLRHLVVREVQVALFQQTVLSRRPSRSWGRFLNLNMLRQQAQFNTLFQNLFLLPKSEVASKKLLIVLKLELTDDLISAAVIRIAQYVLRKFLPGTTAPVLYWTGSAITARFEQNI